MHDAELPSVHTYSTHLLHNYTTLVAPQLQPHFVRSRSTSCRLHLTRVACRINTKKEPRAAACSGGFPPTPPLALHSIEPDLDMSRRHKCWLAKESASRPSSHTHTHPHTHTHTHTSQYMHTSLCPVPAGHSHAVPTCASLLVAKARGQSSASFAPTAVSTPTGSQCHGPIGCQIRPRNLRTLCLALRRTCGSLLVVPKVSFVYC